ncbi:MAG: efflux transporter periplasmic adaptor subunit, partial [Pseudomonadota bacterium]|nr:efflux transporter periplasmic adaptor subunit [Pseudomonadota bacterium]
MLDGAPSKAVRRTVLAATGLMVALVLGAVIVFVLRSLHARALQVATEAHARQYVSTTLPTSNAAGSRVTLSGTLQGAIEAMVFARSSGYIVRWTKDIGAS